MTERLYFDDPYRTEFEATVVRSVEVDGRPGVILNQTCFYPTAGGQSCDRGFLEDIAVVDVLERNGEIVHVVESLRDLERVHGRIDWKRRFDFMQQHSGQHVLSQSMLQVLGAETVSSHLGEEASSIEIGREDLTNAEARIAEEFANTIVFENRPIKTYFVSPDEVAKLPLRKIPPHRGRLRIVEVEGFDYSACGGTHCRWTGEIGLIKVGRWERIRKNVRLQFRCGARALADYRSKSETVETLADHYSARAAEVLNLVMKQAEENRDLRRKLRSFSQRIMELEIQALLAEAVPCGDIKLVQAIFDHRPLDEMKSLALQIANRERAVVLLGNRADKGQLAFACSEGLPYRMNDLIREACARLNGRGGGESRLALGGGPLAEKVEEAIQSVAACIVKGQQGDLHSA
jgi:alanyl-tRNA synthetase